MYCTNCELEIKGDDKEMCPVCGGALSDSQEAVGTLENLEPKEETLADSDDSENSAVFEQEPASGVSGQEEVFVLKDYEVTETGATSTAASDELPLLSDSAQAGTDTVDDLLDSIRESIATPEQQKEGSMPAAEDSSGLDSDFSFFDSDPQDAPTPVTSDTTMEQGTEISWGYDEAENAVSMPEEPKPKRSSALKVVLISALIAVGGYYLLALRSDDNAATDKGVVDNDIPAEISQVAPSESQLEPVPVEIPVVAEPSQEVAEAVAVAEQAPSDASRVAESPEAVAPEAQAAPEAAEADAVAVQVPSDTIKVTESPEAAAPEVQAEPEKPAPVTAPFFTVHVGSYQKRASALSEVARIEAKGYDSFIERADLGGRGIWYRVKVGRFKSRAEAEQLQKKIKKNLVVDSMVVMQRKS